MFRTVTILLSERRKYVKYDLIFFKRKANILKLFELLRRERARKFVPRNLGKFQLRLLSFFFSFFNVHCPHCCWSVLKHKFQKLLSGSLVSGYLLGWLVSMPFFSGLVSYCSPSPSDHTSERCLALIFHDATPVNSHFLKS